MRKLTQTLLATIYRCQHILLLFLLFAVLLLLIFLSCSPGENEEIDGGAWEKPTLNLVNEVSGEVPVLIGVHLGGPYIGVENYGITCSMNGDFLNIDIEGWDTDRPYLPARDPNMLCDSLEKYEDGWYLSCDQHVLSPLFYWWDRFDFDIRKKPDKQGNRGWFHWTVDGDEYFWCIFTFRLTEVDYIWR